MSWLACLSASLLVSVATFWGLGGLVHLYFYRLRRKSAAEWKLQPDRWLTGAQVREAFVLGSFNILIGAIVGGTFAWHVLHGGWSTLYSGPLRHGWLWLVLSLPVTFLAVDAGLYYSHRLFHRRALFRHVHRVHHRFVAPIIFCTTAMHPLEFVVFTAALLFPALIIPVHTAVYLAVVGYTYLVGMVDHSGVRLRAPLPLHGDGGFHDEHHTAFHCNFGHHTQLFDRLHKTLKRADRKYGEDHFHEGIS